MCASKKGISTRQIQRMLSCSMKTAWFLTHRIREAMAERGDLPPLGGMGATVEADETYIGGKSDRKKGRGITEKKIVMALVERGGSVRSFQIPNVKSSTLSEALAKNLRVGTALMTDDASGYRKLEGDFRSHDRIAHAYGEYVRGPIYTNTVEGFFGILKRGLCPAHFLQEGGRAI
jgi:transposase-like protein